MDNGVCYNMDISLNEKEKARCLLLVGDEEVGLYPMLKDLNLHLQHTFIDLELNKK